MVFYYQFFCLEKKLLEEIRTIFYTFLFRRNFYF